MRSPTRATCAGTPPLFGYRIGHHQGDLSMDRRDSAFVMPKCMVVDPAHTWGNDVRPQVPWSRTIIYEAHVKGMTELREGLDPPLRGTFEGLAQDDVIDHLVKLGVTSIELLPIQAFYDDGHLVDKGLSNYWGYNTIGFFAPAQRYLTQDGNLHEFKLMVRRLHEAGIEVLMDVVYNHTAEGNQMGRRSPSAASTMRATTSWATIRATISTRPAAATR
jgi:isoamylase